MNGESTASQSINRLRPMKFCYGAVALACAVALDSCNKPRTEQAPAASSATPAADLQLVEVPADGKPFKPPVTVEQIPSGAWYCDMGTVHWAQMNKGNPICPICKMDLKQKQ